VPGDEGVEIDPSGGDELDGLRPGVGVAERAGDRQLSLLDAEGTPVSASLSDRMLGVDAAQLRAIPEVIGIPYGTVKAPAVLAAVRSGLVHSLVTHTALARALLGEG